jgi:putative flippase GtrA
MNIKSLSQSFISKYLSVWRWGLVGTLTAVIDYFVFLFLYSWTSSVLVANFISGMMSLTFNYLAHYFWSFKSMSEHKQSGKRYLLNFTFFWSLGTIILKLLILFGVEPHFAKIIPVFVIAPLSFLSLKIFVFQKNSKRIKNN